MQSRLAARIVAITPEFVLEGSISFARQRKSWNLAASIFLHDCPGAKVNQGQWKVLGIAAETHMILAVERLQQ